MSKKLSIRPVLNFQNINWARDKARGKGAGPVQSFRALHMVQGGNGIPEYWP